MLRTIGQSVCVLAFAVSTACSDGTGTTTETDEVSFSFSGDTSGAFAASAARSTTDHLAAFQAGNAVVVRSERAATDSTSAFVVLDVLRPFGNGRYDIFSVWAPPAIGTHQLGFACGPYFLDYAPAVQLGNFGAYDNDRDRFYFRDACGSVTIEEFSATRLRGRFSGRALTNSGREVLITDGRFSVGAAVTGSVAASVCQLLGNCQ